MTTARRAAVAGLIGVGALVAIGVRAGEPARGPAAVAADHELASRAGIEVMERGGNAFDGAIAAALAAGVVQPASSGLGGGGFAVWVDGADRGALDFREVAPASAHRDLYRQPDGTIAGSTEGPLSVGVPGEPRGLYRLLVEHGELSAKQVAAPAIRLAKRGFPMGTFLHGVLGRTRFEAVRGQYLLGGVLPEPGSIVRRPDLARTLTLWARSGGEVLHEGEGAAAIAASSAVTEADLAAYLPKERDPIVFQWREYTVVTMAPPSSGGIVLAQVLGAVEDQDLAALGHDSDAYIHVLIEAMKHAYADRARFLGDPDFVDVPVERLLSVERRDEIRAALDPAQTLGADAYGMLFDPPRDGGTQHISSVDAEGRGVALTTTINTNFGSGIVVPGFGVVLNNEMDDFAAAPGVPNAFGLVGAEANRIEPGKRPLSSTTPTVVLDESGQVVLVVGASGGSYIPSAVIQVFLDVLVWELTPDEAVARPRFHHQWMPENLAIEPGFPDGVVEALRARGHVVEIRPMYSAVEVAARTPDGWAAASDPRKHGVAAALPE